MKLYSANPPEFSGLGFRASGFGFRVQDLGLRVSSSGFREPKRDGDGDWQAKDLCRALGLLSPLRIHLTLLASWASRGLGLRFLGFGVSGLGFRV